MEIWTSQNIQKILSIELEKLLKGSTTESFTLRCHLTLIVVICHFWRQIRHVVNETICSEMSRKRPIFEVNDYNNNFDIETTKKKPRLNIKSEDVGIISIRETTLPCYQLTTKVKKKHFLSATVSFEVKLNKKWWSISVTTKRWGRKHSEQWFVFCIIGTWKYRK